MVGKTYNDGCNIGIITECKILSSKAYSHVIKVHLQKSVDKESKIIRVVRKDPAHNEFKII